IARRIRLDGHQVVVQPAVTSVAAAFAAVALPWDDAQVVSAHGRPLADAIRTARRHRKVAVLTSTTGGIVELARAMEDLDRTFVLAERLGEADERVRILPTQQAVELTDIAEPNVVLVLDGHPDDPTLID